MHPGISQMRSRTRLKFAVPRSIVIHFGINEFNIKNVWLFCLFYRTSLHQSVPFGSFIAKWITMRFGISQMRSRTRLAFSAKKYRYPPWDKWIKYSKCRPFLSHRGCKFVDDMIWLATYMSWSSTSCRRAGGPKPNMPLIVNVQN